MAKYVRPALVAATVGLGIAPVVQQERAGIGRLAWLSGCWEASSATRTTEEHWMAPRGRSMLGMSRTVRGDSVVDYELVVLREHGNQIAYEAHPSGQRAAVFTSRAFGDSSAVFENPDHDFPQRVGYQRRGPDSLLAWVEGSADGRARRIDFRYRRVRCVGTE
jgi:hypothetical protein